MLAVALWWFAWTIPGTHVKNVAWPASAVSLILFGYGVNEYSTVLPRYVLESHKSKNDVASAFIALFTTRALFSALFPLFTQQMFENLGNSTAGSILAAIATVFCLAPLILIKFGPKLRGSSGSAAASAADDEEDEKTAAKKAKPRKTVRWGDETDSSNDGSETKSEDLTENESASVGSSEVSRTVTETGSEGGDDGSEGPEGISRVDTMIESRDFASPEMKNESDNDNENDNEDEKEKEKSIIEGAEVSRMETRKSESEDAESAEMSRVETESSSTSGDSSTKKKKKKKAEKKKKEKTKVDDGDNGAAGFLGMGVERLAVLPYF